MNDGNQDNSKVKSKSNDDKGFNKKTIPIFILIILFVLGYFFYKPNSITSSIPPSLISTILKNESIPLSSKLKSEILGSNSAPLGQIVKIGINFNLSSEENEDEIAERNGAIIAIDQFNARSDKPFTIKTVETNNEYYYSNTRELITKEGVVGIIGPDPSLADGIYELASFNKVPIISPGSASMEETLQSDGNPYEYGWSIFPQSNEEGKALAIYAYNDLGLRKVVILYEDTSSYILKSTSNFVEQFKALGGEIIKYIQYRSDESNFESIIREIKDIDLDGIYIDGYKDDSLIQLIEAIQSENLNIPIMGDSWLFDRDMINGMDIYYATDLENLFHDQDRAHSFFEEYQEKYGEEPSIWAILGYDAAQVLISSLEQSGYSGEVLNAQIKQSNFPSIFNLNLDEKTHTAEAKNFTIITLRNGIENEIKEINLD